MTDEIRVTTSFTLPESLHKKLLARVEKEERNMSNIIRIALKKYLEETK